jgi:hypothetical protein
VIGYFGGGGDRGADVHSAVQNFFAQASSAAQLDPALLAHIGSPWQAPYDPQQRLVTQVLQVLALSGISHAGTQRPNVQSGEVLSEVQATGLPPQLVAVEQRVPGLQQPVRASSVLSEQLVGNAGSVHGFSMHFMV